MLSALSAGAVRGSTRSEKREQKNPGNCLSAKREFFRGSVLFERAYAPAGDEDEAAASIRTGAGGSGAPIRTGAGVELVRRVFVCLAFAQRRTVAFAPAPPYSSAPILALVLSSPRICWISQTSGDWVRPMMARRMTVDT